MSKIKFKIDEKSLYYGIYNDYKKGQTATVSTPLNQSKNPDKWHKDILQLLGTGVASGNVPDALLGKCLSKTTSKANTKLIELYEFRNIYLDGKKLDTNASFCIYIKEEIDQTTKSRKGQTITNVHFGRQKLHYPTSLKHKTDGFNIDNGEVLNAIIKQNGGFAYIVRGFEVDTGRNSLNFITTMIGVEGVFLSNVFVKQKGVGKKLLLKEIDLDSLNITTRAEDDSKVQLSKEDLDVVLGIFEKANKSKIENGKRGEEIIIEKLKENSAFYEIYHTSLDYPTSPYDIEYYEDGVKKYVEVKATQGNNKIFNMSSGEIKFMETYQEHYILYLVTNVKDRFPDIYEFTCGQIKKLKFEHPTTKFYA